MRAQFTFHKVAVLIMMSILIIILLSSFSLSEIQAQERNFKDLPEPVRVISLDDYDIYSPISLAMDGDDNLAFTDLFTSQPYIMFSETAEIRAIGNGKGQGPREFIHPVDLDFDSNGNLWVADDRQIRLTIWNNEGELLRTKIPDRLRPLGIAVGSEYFVIMNNNLHSDGVFHLFEINSFNKQFSFENFEQEGYKESLETIGHITATKSALIFTHLYEGFFRKYNFDGKLIYKQQTIEEFKFPGIEQHRTGAKYVSMHAGLATVRPATDGEFLYLLFGGDGISYGTVIDVYQISTGEYSYSFEIEKRGIAVAANDKALSLIQQDEGSFEILLFEIKDL